MWCVVCVKCQRAHEEKMKNEDVRLFERVHVMVMSWSYYGHNMVTNRS